MPPDIRAISDEVQARAAFVDALLAETGKVVVGQRYLVERVLVGLLAGGHVLLEGVPGLAKTLLISIGIHGLLLALLALNPDLLTSMPKRLCAIFPARSRLY